jgi:PKD repeat protein
VEGGDIEFTDVSTTTEDAIAERRWDFGDGVTLTTSNPIIEHTYNTPGTFTVTLTVTDSVGNSGTEVKPELVRVRAERKNVTAVDFTFTPPSPRVGDVVTFTTVVTPSDATRPIHYTWNFGDTLTTTVQISRVQHTYRTYGPYTVELEVENLKGQGRATDRAEITVEPYRAYLPLLLKGG